ncbi:PREDICTED: serine/arginine repetitive matrix protein 2 isoform X2 [Dinoponera quadriceps]|uniref:Serine/arginine repetitive matrix protein 2 isoform X2 n=1 Tax=Dinoponera quadriceps TaxID=609295 RepID=A0A6P3XD91_DINQU|nr:PREDICTED: serine/arginine repetitive matrix protein 2 isoform X2 [Dinoponera quadriceps]
MEPEQRGRASRASSTSSLGREVRCGCQFYQSDSLLPERRALLIRPSSRTMQQPPAVRCSEHEYEPIAPPSLPHPAMAPVVRITDTDVMPVADSDDSIDDRGARLPAELILDGDLVLPLDGKIEDSAMEGRELGETTYGDTSEEQEPPPTAQQLQDRLEERFLDAPTPYTESRTDGEVNTSQVDSSTMEELPLRRGARGLPQRLKTQASKLRSRLRGIQRPTFTFPQRKKAEKTARSSASGGGKSDKSRASEKRPSRMDRIRTSISEKTTKFSLPDRPKFSLPDRSKFHLPERPKFNFPDRSKFTIKKPSIRLADALARVKRPPSLREQQKQRSTESTAGSKRNIFDFATYPRIFDKKSKRRGEYATSSPKDSSRAQSAESATYPRARKGKPLGAKWARHFGNSSSQERAEATASDGSPPWHQASLEEPQEPRLSVRTEEEIMAAARAIPWEDARKERRYDDDEEIQYMDYEQESSQEVSDHRQPPPRRSHKASRRKEEESYEPEEEPRLYGDEEAKHAPRDEGEDQEDWRSDERVVLEEKFRPIPRSRSLDEDMPRVLEEAGYEGAFMAVDPRRFRKMASEEEEEEGPEMEEDLEEHEPSSTRSDREQQHSSGSSCDRRRRGVIEEIDSDEFFLRASGISQDDMNLGSYLPDEIRDALRAEIVCALQDEEMPPQRPVRTRSLRKRKEEDSMEVEEEEEVAPPVRPKRERGARRSREASIVDEVFRERTRSDSRHRVVYQAESAIQPEPRELEPLDDIVVVKPARRKSRSSLRSQSQPPLETSILSASTPPATIVPPMESSSSPFLSAPPPAVPMRRKRSHRDTVADRRNVEPICNGHRDWKMESAASKKAPTTPVRRSQQLLAEGDVVASRDDVEELIGPRNATPVPPKRRSRSRTTSVAADEDRTSHGAESLPEAGYVEEDIPADESSSARDLSGYAIVEKREKPPRPPPPRRRRDKFATTPRSAAPKRPQRAYSTLGPASRFAGPPSDTVTSETTITVSTTPTLLAADEFTPYIEIDLDDEHRDEVLHKIQGRPLPAPPRPPRAKREHSVVERPRTPFEFAETTAATQTDPLPDDMVIEEEVTQAKLIVTPSRSGSQVMVSMERIPSPSRTGTPPVPPLPLISHILRKDEEREEEREDEIGRMAFDTVSLTAPSPTRETERTSRHMSAPHLQERSREEEELRAIRSALFSDEPLRISSLEVGDLKVDRLSVSQIEAHKIVASEVDAMVIATSELRGGGTMEERLSPAIIRELIAIRSHLETVAISQARERQQQEWEEAVSRRVTDVPAPEASEEQRLSRAVAEEVSGDEAVEAMRVEPPAVEDEGMPGEAGEEQKIPNTPLL